MTPRVWREEKRIRAHDGRGYADAVSDDDIRRHISEQAQAKRPDEEFVEFAEAVLELRRWERLAHKPQAGDQP